MAAAAAEEHQAGWVRLCLAEAEAGPGSRRLAALLALRRKHLKETGGVERFRRAGGLRLLLRLLRERATGAGTWEEKEAAGARKELDLGLSILANCCTERRARREVQRLGGIAPLVAILKETSSESVQNRTTRALGNLALETENSITIHQSGAVPVWIRLLSSSQDSDCLQSTVRTLRILANSPSHRRSLASQGCLPPLLALLARPEHALLHACVRAVSHLTHDCGPLLAQQLIGHGGLDLLTSLASQPSIPVREGALSALSNICDQAFVRPALGAAGGVRLLVDSLRRDPVSPSYPSRLRALCLCCREAVNRARVRESGGLELLLALLLRSRNRADASRIVSAFLSFFYDQQALDLLAARGLVPILVGRLNEAGGGREVPGTRGGTEREEEDGPHALSFDFPPDIDARAEQEEMSEGSGSFLSLRSWLVSEGYIENPGDLSPAPSHPEPSPCLQPAPCQEEEEEEEEALVLGPADRQGQASPGASIADPSPAILGLVRPRPAPETPALLLLSRFSQAEEPPPALLTEASLRGMLSYLAQSRPGSVRCFRLLSRLACNPNCLEPLVRARVVPLLRALLCRPLPSEGLCPPERTEVGAGPRLKELGEVLLRNLGAQAESAFGVGTLTHMLLSSTESDRTSCAMAIPLLCRNSTIRRKLLVDHRGLALLLQTLLSGADPLDAQGAAEAVGELAGTPAREGEESEEEGGEGDPWVTCPYAQLVSEGGMDFCLLLDGGQRVPANREQLLAGSKVFEAMLGGSFLESGLAEVAVRDLDPEACSLLLHHLHGCLPPSCPILRPPPPCGPESLEESLLGRCLATAGRFLLPGLSGLLRERALGILPTRRLPELHQLAERHGLPLLAAQTLGRLLDRPSRPEARAEIWARLGRGCEDPQGLLGGLHALLLGYL